MLPQWTTSLKSKKKKRVRSKENAHTSNSKIVSSWSHSPTTNFASALNNGFNEPNETERILEQTPFSNDNILIDEEDRSLFVQMDVTYVEKCRNLGGKP